MKYRCVQRTRSTRLWCTRFCPMVARRVVDERVLSVFDNDCISHILNVGRRDCGPSVELRCHLCLTGMPALLMQKRLLRFGHAARRPGGELITDLLLPTQPRTWRRRTGGQLKMWATTIKADLEPISGPRVFGYARWRKDWVKVSSELAHDRRAWSARSTQFVMPAQPAPAEWRHK